jgi:hypothetical protein
MSSPTLDPIHWVSGALSSGTKRPKSESDPTFKHGPCTISRARSCHYLWGRRILTRDLVCIGHTESDRHQLLQCISISGDFSSCFLTLHALPVNNKAETGRTSPFVLVFFQPSGLSPLRGTFKFRTAQDHFRCWAESSQSISDPPGRIKTWLLCSDSVRHIRLTDPCSANAISSCLSPI